MQLRTSDLMPESWPDFEALFADHKGVRGGCWCTFFRCSASEYDVSDREQRKALHHRLVYEGAGHGLLLYEANARNDAGTGNDAPAVAWCQYGPPEAFPRFDRMRAYTALDLPTEQRPAWRIACLFVHKRRRRAGLAKLVLRATLQRISEQGGGLTEAFPLDVGHTGQPPYSGSVAMYQRERFEPVARLGKNAVLMRRNVANAA